MGSEMCIRDRLRADNPLVTILVAEIIPLGHADTSSLNAAIRAWAPGQSTNLSPVIVVDQHTGYDAVEHSYDSYHPNAIGEELMATRWFGALQDVLGEAEVPELSNEQPIAMNDSAVVTSGESVSIAVLANDEDADSTLLVDSALPESETATVLIVSGPSNGTCLLYTSPSPRDATLSRMPSSA